MNSKKEQLSSQLIILASSIFGLISFLMSILGTSTSGWQVDSHWNKTGLFRRCYRDVCTRVVKKHDLSIVYSLIGQCLIIFAVICSFLHTFIYRHRYFSILITLLYNIGSVFLWITFLSISSFLLMNGGSAIIFNAAVAFCCIAGSFASYAVGVAFVC